MSLVVNGLQGPKQASDKTMLDCSPCALKLGHQLNLFGLPEQKFARLCIFAVAASFHAVRCAWPTARRITDAIACRILVFMRSFEAPREVLEV